MKPKSLLLSALLITQAAYLSAAEATFFITEDGEALNNITVSVDGEKKLLNNKGFISFNISAGDHKVELFESGEWIGDLDFSNSTDENADIKIEMIAGEAVSDVSLYQANDTTNVARGAISGVLMADETGSVVDGAIITVAGSDVSVSSDANGSFTLELPRGKYDLSIDHPNYGSRQVDGVMVMANSETAINLNLSLSGDGVIEELVAVGTYTPNTGVTDKRDASTVLDSIDSEQFARFGDSSVSSALKRVAGVSVIGGEFAVIRGLQGRYNSTLLNSGLIPSTDSLKRDVPLDLFPASVLKGIEIKKGFTPDLPGDSTGGAIDMITKEMPAEDYFELDVGLGVTTGVTGKDVVSYEGSGSDWVGLDDGLRALPGDVDGATDFGTPGSLNVCSGSACLPGDVTPATAADLGKSFPNIWNTKDKTAGPDFDIGLAGGKLFEMDGGDFGVYGAVDYSSSWESRQDATIDDPREGQYSYDRSKYKVDLTAYLALEYDNGDNQYRSKTIVLRKSDDLTKVQKGVNLEGSEKTDVILQWTERQFIFQQFSGEHAFSEGQHVVGWHVGGGQSFRNQPDRRSYAFVNGIATPLTAERRYKELTEDSFDARLDYSFVDFHWADDVRSTVKVGVYTSAKDRENKLARFGFRTNGFDTAGLDFEEVMAPENFDDESIALRVRTSSTDSYNSTDNLSAFYGSLETTFYDTVDVIFGARQETAEQIIDYPNSTQDQSVYKTDELLPMLAATWRIDEVFQLRAGFSQTLARPGIVERSQSQLFDPDTDQAVTGNPDLVISEISNLDLRLEMYLTDDSSMSWAIFTKDITNPIEKTTIPQCSGTACEGYTFANQESATVSGFEYDFTTNIIDSGDWSAFLSGNIAFIDSEVTLGAAAASSEGQSKRKLQGQSDVLANMQIGFDHLETMQSFTLVANFFDDRIYEIQRNGDDKIENGRMIFDFIYNWDISESLRLNAKVKNIFNEKVSYSRSDEEIESYTEGTEIEAKVTWRF